MLDQLAGLGVQLLVLEQVKAEDDDLLRLAKELRDGAVEQTQLIEDVQAELLLLDPAVPDRPGVDEHVAGAGEEQGQQDLHPTLLQEPERDLLVDGLWVGTAAIHLLQGQVGTSVQVLPQ